MYAFLIGEIDSKSNDCLVLNVNGVGYELIVSNNTILNIGQVGETVKVLTYLQVREDAQVLYGFYNKEEKQMFTQLITVSGIGPKMAITVLSSLGVSNIIQAISLGDVKAISSAKGVGKKTAERIVLELKNKVGAIATYNEVIDGSVTAMSTPQTESVELLVSMGLSKLSASELVKQVAQSEDSTEQIIAKALRNMR